MVQNNNMNVNEHREVDPLGKSERSRSNFVLDLVQCFGKSGQIPAAYLPAPPKRIVQFWDDLHNLPNDVKECMDSWTVLEQSGFELEVFDKSSSREFIRIHLGSRYEQAFDKCYHPSMKSDYFRYSYIFIKGGFYIDADDVYHGTGIDHLFTDGRLKLQPFCYDIKSAQMVSPSVFLNLGADSQN
jgi:mannosyltransferase OCH1-like enzyme